MNGEEHKQYHRRLVYIMIVIILILFGSATFYHYAERWDYIDALYFSAATMTTVGYGDITPKTFPGKIFTIVFVFVGVGIALYGISVIAAHFVEARERVLAGKAWKNKNKAPHRDFLGEIRGNF